MNSEMLNLPNISIRQIQMCVAVHRSGRIGVAAELLGVSPSAVSMAVREAEKQLGIELFHRTKYQLKASESGRTLFPRMEELLRQVEEFRTVIDGPEENLRGHLVIGASSTIGCYLLPECIASFQKKYPLVDIDLYVANTAEILEKLVNYTVDVAFVEGPSVRTECELDHLWEDEMIVFAHNSHPLVSKSNPKWKDLSGEQWLLREQGSGTHSILAVQFAKYGIHPNRAIHVGNTEAVIRCVEKGLGIACLSRFAVQRSLEMGLIAPIGVTPIRRHFYHATIQRRFASRLSQRFLEEMKSFQPNF